MATVYIGGASIDERGKASGGQAGTRRDGNCANRHTTTIPRVGMFFERGILSCVKTSP